MPIPLIRVDPWDQSASNPSLPNLWKPQALTGQHAAARGFGSIAAIPVKGSASAATAYQTASQGNPLLQGVPYHVLYTTS